MADVITMLIAMIITLLFLFLRASATNEDRRSHGEFDDAFPSKRIEKNDGRKARVGGTSGNELTTWRKSNLDSKRVLRSLVKEGRPIKRDERGKKDIAK